MILSCHETVFVLYHQLESYHSTMLFLMGAVSKSTYYQLSIGSGSTFSYVVFDQSCKRELTDEEAQELGRKRIYTSAGRRDGFTANTSNLNNIK